MIWVLAIGALAILVLKGGASRTPAPRVQVPPAPPTPGQVSVVTTRTLGHWPAGTVVTRELWRAAFERRDLPQLSQPELEEMLRIARALGDATAEAEIRRVMSRPGSIEPLQGGGPVVRNGVVLRYLYELQRMSDEQIRTYTDAVRYAGLSADPDYATSLSQTRQVLLERAEAAQRRNQADLDAIERDLP